MRVNLTVHRDTYRDLLTMDPGALRAAMRGPWRTNRDRLRAASAGRVRRFLTGGR